MVELLPNMVAILGSIYNPYMKKKKNKEKVTDDTKSWKRCEVIRTFIHC
jgi:hypothetical protein